MKQGALIHQLRVLLSDATGEDIQTNEQIFSAVEQLAIDEAAAEALYHSTAPDVLSWPCPSCDADVEFVWRGGEGSGNYGATNILSPPPPPLALLAAAEAGVHTCEACGAICQLKVSAPQVVAVVRKRSDRTWAELAAAEGIPAGTRRLAKAMLDTGAPDPGGPAWGD